MTDTPRTDAETAKLGAESLNATYHSPHVAADFARQLERERNDLSGALLKARMMLAHINLFISHDDPLYADVVAYFASDSQNDQTLPRLPDSAATTEQKGNKL